MADWVDVTLPDYWVGSEITSTPPYWYTDRWKWESYYQRGYLIGDSAFMPTTTAIRLTVSLTDKWWLETARFRAVDDALSDLGTETRNDNGNYTITLNLTGVATMIRFDIRYYNMFITKIEVFTDWVPGAAEVPPFWTNFVGQEETCP